MITICLLATALFAFQDSEKQISQKPKRQWRTPIEIANQVRSFDSVTTTTIGFSKNGMPIQCIEVARESKTPIENRAAILVVAGIDGHHLLGTEVATDLVAVLLALPDRDAAGFTSVVWSTNMATVL